MATDTGKERITVQVPKDLAARIRHQAPGGNVTAWFNDVAEAAIRDAELAEAAAKLAGYPGLLMDEGFGDLADAA